MNDRFKFRAWFAPDWQKPEMIYEAEHTYDNRCCNKGSFHHESFGEILEDKDCIVMQCTGLKDKNGKLVYEGDIVKTSKGIANVEYDNTYAYFGLTNFLTVFSFDNFINEEMEVIGNIYENKELFNESINNS